VQLTITAHALPGPAALLDPALLPGSVAVVIDLLRASTTVTRALSAGAAAVVPCLEPADALRLRDAGTHGPCILGGERRGVRIDGFDLGNSPSEYTPDAVRGRTLLFSTTNGTRAVLLARQGGAARILIGCLANRAALCRILAADGRPVRLICAGTGGAVGVDDCLCAGAIIDGLLAHLGPGGVDLADDQAQLFHHAFAAVRDPAALLAALRASRGGRNLIAIGLEADIADAARADTTTIVPELDPATGAFRPAAFPSPTAPATGTAR